MAVPTTGSDPLAGFRRYLGDTRPEVFLDTNILIKAVEANWHDLIVAICDHLDVRISDTVYWEFLRNVNIEKFRKRRSALAEWQGGDLLHESRIKREDADVHAMHDRIVILMLKAYASDPVRVLKFLTPDLWIAAAAVHYRADHVLTTNADDFPPCLFTSKATAGSENKQIHLMVFDRLAARSAWKELLKNPAFSVDCRSLL